MKQKILLIDTSCILHGAKHAAGKRISPREKNTFVIYGFFLKLQELLRKTYPDIIVFANDGCESVRKQKYPRYKEQRKKQQEKRTPAEKKLDETAYKQFNTVKEYILPEIGFRNIFSARGLEADDIIGSICKDYKDCQIYIVTTDADMYQLLSDNVCIYLPVKRKFFTKKDFKKKYGIEPKMWKRIKAIAGCPTDNVEGIKGVAEATALKFIKGKLPHHYKAYKDITSPEGKKIINRNKGLVILPHRETPHFRIRPDHVSKNKLIAIAEEFNLHAIKKDIKYWAKILKAK